MQAHNADRVEGPKRPRRRVLLRLALALALAVVLLDVGLSLVAMQDGAFMGRPLPPFDALMTPPQAKWLDEAGASAATRKGIGRFDARLGWTHVENAASKDGLRHTNSLGARGRREYGPVPPAGVTRLVCFGDSFTFCEEVPDDAAWPHLLEEHRPDVEAINFGVGGYGTGQALLRMRDEAASLGAQAITMGILLENVGRNVNRYRPLWYPLSTMAATKPRFVLAGGELELIPQPYTTAEEMVAAIRDESVLERVAEHEYWIGRPTVPDIRFSSLFRLAAGYFAYTERQPRRLLLDEEGEPFQVSAAILEAFVRDAAAAGIPHATVLVFPRQVDLDAYLRGDHFWSGFLEELERRGIPYIDLAEPLAARHRECEADPELGVIYSGSHLSVVGNAVVSQVVADWLAVVND